MAFTFTNYAGIQPQASPLHDIIGKVLGGYTDTVRAKYLPQQQEADIFTKEISPLAALASSPNFTGFNPEIQKMIAKRIGGYLNKTPSHGYQQNFEEGNTPGYASDEDIYNRLSRGSHETFGPGKRLKGAISKGLNLAEQFGLSPQISEALGGTQTSQEQASFEQAIEEGIQRLKLKGYSDNTARKLIERMPGENDATYSKRIKSLFINKPESSHSNIDNKINRDEQERADAEATAAAFSTPDRKVTSEDVMEALSMGVKTKKQFEEFMNWKKDSINKFGEQSNG